MYYRQQDNHLFTKPFLLEVVGDGEITIPPNLATINLGVVTEGKELIQAEQENAISITKIINSLLSLGVPKKLIQTFDYRIESEYDFDQGKQLFRGYKVTHLLNVKIEDLNLVGKIVDTSVQQGANYVANVQFTVKNKEAVYQQALSAAIDNALHKAQTIAGSLKVHLFPTPIQVTESVGEGARPLINQSVTYVKGITSTQFEPGELIVKARVIAKFHYNP
ncbi:SIMPL domain-containing protein [Neobacillus sp. PS3-40]|uniref:SIMPL domain-containing protein n=1 Tax=Neobacillus sp. PS3-40 TaxID=3070679 RepID=UPI0027E1B024|nr:SIMPL domain-containing protein [Neobacillus sp. PS3-40]WML45257.1 SIMPL domain-containing protein [Neobacillus sp. PS3-40]